MRRTVIATIIMGIFLMGNVTNSHAGETYLFVEGVPGEAMESKHRGWLKINSFSWDGARSQSIGSKGGSRTLPRANLKSLNVAMNLDGSFPKLALALALGRTISKVILEEVHPKTKQPIFKITLDNVIVSHVGIGSSSKQVPTVTLNFDYGRIQWNYTVQDQRTGKTKGDIRAQWDVRSQKGG